MSDATRAQAWRVALAGLLALAVAMGIGRFAFTPLLPMMLRDAELTLPGGAALASANYLGYFVGALLCMRWRVEPATTMRAGLVATVLLTLAMGAHSVLGALGSLGSLGLRGEPATASASLMPLWTLLRGLAGVASAGVFVFTSGWCLQRLAQLGHVQLGGIIFCGPGVGIAITGLAAGGMTAHGWPAAWGWLSFGVLAAVMVALLWSTVRGDAATAPRQRQALALGGETIGLTLAYGIAGFGYIITATFLPVMARIALPGSAWPDYFWPIFGAAVALGALLSTRVGMTHDNRRLLTGCYVLQAAAVMLAVVWPTVVGFALSSLLLGVPFTAITLFAMREARRLQSGDAAALMGLMTATYGAGQIAGPPLATALVHRTGSFAPSLWVAAAALLIGAMGYDQLRRRWPLSG